MKGIFTKGVEIYCGITTMKNHARCDSALDATSWREKCKVTRIARIGYFDPASKETVTDKKEGSDSRILDI